MPTLEDTKKYYDINPPQLDFGGAEGSFVSSNPLDKLDNKEKERHQLNASNIILTIHQNAHNPTPRSKKIFFAVRFDKFGSEIPALLPLPPQMEGHELHITLYLDNHEFITMIAIGKGNNP